MGRHLDSFRKRKWILIFVDLLIAVVIAYGAVAFHGDAIKASTLALFYGCVFLSRIVFRIYGKVWRYAAAAEYLGIVISDIAGGLLFLALTRLVLPDNFMMANWEAVSLGTQMCLATVSSRYCYQLIYKRNKINGKNNSENGDSEEAQKTRAAIIGAGTNGYYLADELMTNRQAKYFPCFFVDNDNEKIGNTICGLKILSSANAIEKLRNEGIRDVIITVSDSNNDGKRAAIFDEYTAAGFSVMLYEYPLSEGGAESVYDKSKGPVVREFRIEDLLFREPVSLDGKNAKDTYRGKTILITGGGGSIGSEICRRLAKYEPKKLVIFDSYENNAYDIQQELKLTYGEKLDVAVEISSVRDPKRVLAVMREYMPEIVVHAAAHKHVPLMEHNPSEAIKNNVFGTYNVANAAEKCGVGKFILISTDKAVNPTNVMGASKRLCEMIIQSRSESKTKFMAVRFGNVLGSNGSVIPLFKRQIASGGPITLTDKRIIRYFMTIPEAAQLVLEAGAMAKKGELFVLDMGRPVKILKLAEDMIRLSGLRPYVDIDIREIGLREGEKLYEELLIKSGHMEKTENDLIFVEQEPTLSREEVSRTLEKLRAAAENGNIEQVKGALRLAVPTYHEPEEVNSRAEEADEIREEELVTV